MLSKQIVKNLAKKYGFEANNPIVLENAQQANELHGKYKGYTSWSTDEYGCLDAEKLLDGYLCEESRVINCDNLAAINFENEAYGN